MSDPHGDLPPWPASPPTAPPANPPGASGSGPGEQGPGAPGGPPGPSTWPGAQRSPAPRDPQTQPQRPHPTAGWGAAPQQPEWNNPTPSAWPTPGGSPSRPVGGVGWPQSNGPSFPSGPPLGPPTAFGGPGPQPAPGRPPGRGLKIAVAILAAACLLLGGIAIGAFASRDSITASNGTVTPTVVPTTGTPGGTVPGNAEEPAAAVAVQLRPAVVQLENDEGLGSGVVYDSTNGLILTNAHVVGTSDTMSVSFDDGRTAEGSVLGKDTDADIAVVKIDAFTGLSQATLDDGKVLVGQMAIAIGSPFGLSESVTAGIVSAVDRPVDGSSSVSINMIQTDAPINPGNSGGALANRRGAVIGINTAIFSQTGDNSGIGFAIPIQTAKAIADKIVSGGSLAHGYLGVTSTLPDNGNGGGAEIASVSAGSPAKDAGLEIGDVITSIDKETVRSPQDLSARILIKSPGDVVTLEVVHDGTTRTVTATLVARPSTSKRTTTTTR